MFIVWSFISSEFANVCPTESVRVLSVAFIEVNAVEPSIVIFEESVNSIFLSNFKVIVWSVDFFSTFGTSADNKTGGVSVVNSYSSVSLFVLADAPCEFVNLFLYIFNLYFVSGKSKSFKTISTPSIAPELEIFC